MDSQSVNIQEVLTPPFGNMNLIRNIVFNVCNRGRNDFIIPGKIGIIPHGKKKPVKYYDACIQYLCAIGTEHTAVSIPYALSGSVLVYAGDDKLDPGYRFKYGKYETVAANEGHIDVRFQEDKDKIVMLSLLHAGKYTTDILPQAKAYKLSIAKFYEYAPTREKSA